MALVSIVQAEALKVGSMLTPDVIPMFQYVFSQLGTLDEYLQAALNKFPTNEEKVRYLVHDILQLATNGCRDAGFWFAPRTKYGIETDNRVLVDGYAIWYVIKEDASLNEYLRTDIIKFPPGSMHKLGPEEIGENKVEYPAFNGLLHGYMQLAPFEEKWKVYEFLLEHFRKSPIRELNLTNTYNEILRISSS